MLLGTAETAAWAVAELRRRHGPLPFQALDAAAWQQRLGEQYRDGGDAAAVVGAAESEVDLDRLMQDMPEVTDLLDAQDDAPVIRMINALLAQAARDGASDLHIEPFETHSVVRYRVDGTLRDMVQPRRALHAALVSLGPRDCTIGKFFTSLNQSRFNKITIWNHLRLRRSPRPKLRFTRTRSKIVVTLLRRNLVHGAPHTNLSVQVKPRKHRTSNWTGN